MTHFMDAGPSTTHDQGGLKIALLESLVDVGTWKLAVYRNYYLGTP